MDPGHELARRERLREVVVGADRQADDPVDLLIARGEEEDVRIREGPDPAKNLESVEAREHHVKHDDIGGCFPRDLDRGWAVDRFDDRHPLLLEKAANDGADRRLIVDDEHACLGASLRHAHLGYPPPHTAMPGGGLAAPRHRTGWAYWIAIVPVMPAS